MKNALRLDDVSRWSMVRTKRQQSVAEHSFRVAVIAAKIAHYAGDCDVDTVFMAAAMHDVSEAVTGDIPSHVKKAVMAKTGVSIDDLGDYWFHSTSISWIIKAADMIETIAWLTDNADGDHAHQVLRDVRANLVKFMGGLGHNEKSITIMVMDAVMCDHVHDFNLRFSGEQKYE